jgi:hypothetical protein
MAAPLAQGTGNFQTALLDVLHRVSPDDLARHVAIEAV